MKDSTFFPQRPLCHMLSSLGGGIILAYHCPSDGSQRAKQPVFHPAVQSSHAREWWVGRLLRSRSPGAKPVCLSHNTVKCCSLDTVLSKTVNYYNMYSQNLLLISQDLVNSFVAEYFYLNCTLPLSYTKIYVYLVINIVYRIIINSKT